MIVQAGATDVTTYFVLRTAADGTATTGATITSIDLQYCRSGAAPAAKVDATALAATDSAHADNKSIEVDATDQPGLYRVDWPDAAFAAGVREVILTVKLASSFTEHLRVELSPAVDAVAISGNATAADNLETLYDGVEGFAPAYAGPRGPGVYLDDAAANTNTANGVDGTHKNQVSTIAAAKTIADSLGVKRIYLVNNSSVTLVATMEDYEIVGIGEMMANTVTLGSQDVDRSVFYNLLLTGTQGGTGRCQPEGCVLSVISSMEVTALGCLLADAGSLTLRNDCAFDRWWSAVAGGGTPKLNINSVANVDAYLRHGSGGIQIDNAVATTVMSIETDGQVVVGATCTSLEVHARGNMSVTDNGTTTNLNLDAALSQTTIRSAVGLATANLDTQIGEVPTVSEFNARTLVAASYATAAVCTEARLAELDAANLPTDIAAIPTTAMRGTDSAALASVCTEARLAELDGANLPADIAAIPTTAMRGTDSAALAATALSTATWTAARAGALTDWIDGGRLDLLLDQIIADLPNTITKNTALAGFPFFMVLTSDHITGATGLTVTAERTLDGAAFAACANAVVEIGSGVYKIDFAAGDLNGDTVCLKFTAATADARILTIVTKPT